MRALRTAPPVLTASLILALAGTPAMANNTAQNTPFVQAWSNGGQITVDDDWSQVPGVIGYLGDIDAGAVTAINPQTLLLDYAGVSAVDVVANQAAATSTTGGVFEYDGLANPVVGIQGSGGSDAPHLLVHLSTLNRENIRVRYNVRDIDATTDNAIQPVALHFRVGSTGGFTNVPGGFVTDASTGPSLATLVTPIDITLPAAANNQALVTIRIMTANAVGSDEWVGIDDLNFTGDGLGGLPIVSISDAQVSEGNVPGQFTNLAFTISLSTPAPAGGTRFDAITSDGTATTADNDYLALSLNDVLIPAGQLGTTVTVLVNHDLVGEPNQTMTVTLSDLVGGLAGTMQGTGTILNDDPLEIFDIQGSGTASTLVGSTAITNNNVVTALAPNGFFMQTPSARDDGNLATSNGIFVFTASAPTVQAGDSVNVTGTVQEFFEFTQLSGALTVTVNNGGNPLPPPVALNSTFPSPLLSTPSCFSNANPEFANFECIEGMRANLTDAVISSPNQRFGADPLAEAVITAGPGRGFREPGIPTPGLMGIAPTIPIWDRNPEVFELDPDKLLLPNRILTGGSRFNADGVIGYDFGDFEFWPTVLNVTQPVVLPVPVQAPAAADLTIGSINMLRMFDLNQANNINSSTNCSGAFTCTSLTTCNEVAEAGDYERRLAKFSAYIRIALRAPDVVGVQEVENLAVLQDIANKIALDDPSVVYSARLEEGSDVGGIDSGFLIRAGRINPGFIVTQLNKAELFNGDSPSTCLHDRPPLRLDGVFSIGNRPFSVIVNHTRSLSGIGDCRVLGAGSSGRNCLKRLAQSESIATLVQQFQTNNPLTPLVVIGDHNAFQFTDGHVDTLGIIRGTATLAGSATPDSQLAPIADIVQPNLNDGLSNVPVQQRYSFFFDRALQVLDHALMTAPAQTVFAGMSYARANLDYPIIFERTVGGATIYGDDLLPSGFESSNEWKPLRVSDHDGFVIRLFE